MPFAVPDFVVLCLIYILYRQSTTLFQIPKRSKNAFSPINSLVKSLSRVFRLTPSADCPKPGLNRKTVESI